MSIMSIVVCAICVVLYAVVSYIIGLMYFSSVCVAVIAETGITYEDMNAILDDYLVGACLKEHQKFIWLWPIYIREYINQFSHGKSYWYHRLLYYTKNYMFNRGLV